MLVKYLHEKGYLNLSIRLRPMKYWIRFWSTPYESLDTRKYWNSLRITVRKGEDQSNLTYIFTLKSGPVGINKKKLVLYWKGIERPKKISIWKKILNEIFYMKLT